MTIDSKHNVVQLKRKDIALPASQVIGWNQLLRLSQQKQPGKTLNCVACRLVITSPQERIEVDGKHAHIFVNPHGYSFMIGCFAHVGGVAEQDEPQAFWSWFAGYRWQIVLCRQCRLHLGWYFSGPSHFHGLISNRLISVDPD